jgi:alkanesulfonate monooxygenase SsuD/methylene tetrahydromethanopterin reductase-like flavin-dependent oxidoreductase (luciferase family)
MTGIQVGLLLPSRDTAMTGAHNTAGLIAFALQAEQAGFDSVWTGDSPLARTRVDPLILLAGVATVTTRITLGTAALVAALRHPVLAAHALASLDQLCGGRLVAGVAAGFPGAETEREFTEISIPFQGRVRALDAAIDSWRAGWASRPSTEAFVPLPAARAEGPPIWLAGGDTPRAIERTASRFDGWLPFLPDSRSYARAWRDISSRAAELGRTVTPAMYATISVHSDPARAEAELDEYLHAYYRRPLAVMRTIQAYHAGPPDSVLTWLRSYIDAGARHLILRIGSFDTDQQLHHLAEDLLPTLRSGN